MARYACCRCCSVGIYNDGINRGLLQMLTQQCHRALQSRPLDIIAETYRDGGLAGFFGGNAAGDTWALSPQHPARTLLCSSRRRPDNMSRLCSADVLRVMPSKAIELMAFDVFKTVFHRKGERPGPGGTMLSGALAGLCR
jgi:hypothetical protein